MSNETHPFEWRIGRLDDPQISSLRYFTPFIQKRELKTIYIIFGLTLLVSLGYSPLLTLILLCLPLLVLLYTGIMQHLLFKDVVNKKFVMSWHGMALLVEWVLKEKELPFQRQNFDRRIVFTLGEELEITVFPCQQYHHPRTQAVRWMIFSKGKVSDVAIRPLTPETYPLIESITLKIDGKLGNGERETGDETLPEPSNSNSDPVPQN